MTLAVATTLSQKGKSRTTARGSRDMDFRDVDFRDMDFRDVDFRDMDFRDMDFRDMDFRDVEHRGTRGLPPWPCLPHAFIMPSERHVRGTVQEGDTFPHREMRLEFLIKVLQPERSHCMKPACRDKPVSSLKQSVTFRIVKDGQRV